MSTITREFTKEQLQQIIETDHVQCGEASSLARIALASIEAEAVAWLLSGGGAKNNVSFDSGNAYADPLREVTPLYTAPPEPPAYKKTENFTDYHAGWNACRAAMLNHSEHERDMVEPVSQPYKLPERVTNALTLSLQAMEFMGDTLNNLDAVCKEDVEFVAPAFEAVRAALAGNSPVMPDGWVILPAEPTQAMMNAWLSEVANWRGHAAGYRAMIAAAPQQEA